MRKGFAFVMAMILLVVFTACGNTANDTALPSETVQESSAPDANNIIENEPPVFDSPARPNGNADMEGVPDMTTAPVAHSNSLYLQIGEKTLTATLVESTSTEALKELLAQGPITIDMRDYGGFEKVGGFETSLPRNDEHMDAEPGDLILYQGNSFVIFYASNSWNYTRLGKINNVTADELKNTLGSGNVSVTLSLNK